MSKETLVVDDLYEYSGLLNLSRFPDIQHAVTSDDIEVLVCNADISYPSGGNGPLRELILPRMEAVDTEGKEFNGKVLRLPEDYLTLGGVLNESFSVMSPRSEEFLRGVLREIGTGLKRVRNAGQGIPKQLSYRQIIIQRDVDAFNILPPLEMETDERRDGLAKLGELMLQECQNAAETSGRVAKLTDLFIDYFDAVQDN